MQDNESGYLLKDYMKKTIILIIVFLICFTTISAQCLNHQISISIKRYEKSSYMEEVLISVNNGSPTNILITNILVYSTESKLIYLDFPNYSVFSGNYYMFSFRSIGGPSLFSDGWIIDMEYVNITDGVAYVKRVLKPARQFSTNTPLTDISDDYDTSISPLTLNREDKYEYNMSGQRIGKNYKGIVISNGKKRIIR